jgi:hypothetical protein
MSSKAGFTFYLPKELVEELEKIIALYRIKKNKKLTKTEVVEKALEKEIKRLKEELGEV